MTYMEHLQDNLRTFCPLDPLSDADKEFLEETAQQLLRYPTIPCNDCKYCMPCPYGLDIPGIVGYDRSVPKLRQANHCIGCNQCVHHCPQNIHIPEEMQRIDKFVEDLKQGREF